MVMALLSYNTDNNNKHRDDIQVGQVLTATLPITEDSDNADNKLDTGQYIVTDMKYLFTLNKARGQITLKLVKDSTLISKVMHKTEEVNSEYLYWSS